jgi:Fe-S cluster biogenesis protein NfuA
MTTTTPTPTDTDALQMKHDVAAFLRRECPQIAMHGGQAAITSAEPTTGHVEVVLGGACDGCLLSPATLQLIETRLPQKVASVRSISVRTAPLEDL